MRPSTEQGVAHNAFSPALPVSGILPDSTALDHTPIRLDTLLDGLDANPRPAHVTFRLPRRYQFYSGRSARLGNGSMLMHVCNAVICSLKIVLDVRDDSCRAVDDRSVGACCGRFVRVKQQQTLQARDLVPSRSALFR